jgi:hypothetical protein
MRVNASKVSQLKKCSPTTLISANAQNQAVETWFAVKKTDTALSELHQLERTSQ